MNVLDPERLQVVLESRPRLAAGVDLVPQVHRGRTWYLLRAPATGEHWLLDRPAFEFVAALDGEATVAGIATKADLDHEDVVALLATLAEAEALEGELARGPLAALEASRERERRARLQTLLRPLSVRLPLLDPEPLLRRLQPLAGGAFSRGGLALWLLVVLGGGLTALQAAPALAEHFSARFLDPLNLVLLWFVYPLVKGVHELGHGLAARRFGAPVHELGVMLLVFVPVPYVDASATSAFRSSRHRMIVAAAGIATELLLAALAIIAWTAAEPGLGRDLLFDVAVVGGISTLLFNGNPLLRFDGYYVLVDALQIPNLGPRSQRQLGYLTRRYLLGLDDPPPDLTRGEGAWLVGYGLASGAYRLVVSFGIALFVGSRFFVIGVLLALWFLWQQFVAPLGRSLVRVVPEARAAGRLQRLVGISAAALLVVTGALFGVPVSRTTVADAILAPPERSVVRAGATGFVLARHVPTGVLVEADEALLELRDVDLEFEVQRLAARQEELRALRGLARAEDRVEAQRLEDELRTVDAELVRARSELDRLLVAAPVAGLVSWSTQLEPGRYVERGDVLGFVTGDDDWRLRVIVDQRGMGRLREGVAAVDVVSRSAPGSAGRGLLVSETPLAVDVLPDRALGTLGGGAIAVDQRDVDGLRLLVPMFEVEVRLEDGRAGGHRIGQRFLVRFVHASTPMGPRLVERLNTLLRTRLDW